MNKLLLFPFNGNSVEALDCAIGWQIVGFIDDNPQLAGQSRHGFAVYGRDALTRFPDAQVLACPGSPESYLQRSQLIQSLGVTDDRWARVVHPDASLSPRARVGRNTLIMAGVRISGGASVGNHVCILPNSVVHHDCSVGDYALVGSNVTLAGFATVGENTYIGSGARVLQRIKIGARSLVGMGSTVLQDVREGVRVAGTPAREIGAERGRGGAQEVE